MSAEAAARRVVLITGAAGGLGQGLVREFAAQGWRVAAGVHHSGCPAAGEQAWEIQLDVTIRSDAEAASQQILARWGRIDVLINNAGVTADGLTWQIGEDDWDKILAVNLKGAFLCSQAVIGQMIKQRDGHIINMASLSGRSGTRGQANYAAAKAGLFGLTQSLAREVGSRSVRVNAIVPGVLPTPMTAGLGEQRLAQFAAANVLGRLNTVAEAARFVVFLAGMQNVSGQLFQLDSRICRWS